MNLNEQNKNTISAIQIVGIMIFVHDTTTVYSVLLIVHTVSSFCANFFHTLFLSLYPVCSFSVEVPLLLLLQLANLTPGINRISSISYLLMMCLQFLPIDAVILSVFLHSGNLRQPSIKTVLWYPKTGLCQIRLLFPTTNLYVYFIDWFVCPLHFSYF